ncbi:DUF1611 domain-containing protein [Cyclobacterium xiamenense]|uniref:DUF1611 domain-containing protein n=1 Tax=Cyclobacterium xiamenense TaxID=1297121 RepID=UPI0012B9F47D|nr:DUF1611 domain-containing protein [Cyclobacterium xiamenense]
MENRIKIGMACAGVKTYEILYKEEITKEFTPKKGDVGLFKVKEIGKHGSLRTLSRNVAIIPGDLIMGAFGSRYATNQFEGYVPDGLEEEYHLLGGGGVIGKVKTMHARLVEMGPTTLELVGIFLNDKGEIANSIKENQHRLVPFTGMGAQKTKVILSLGSSMDSGKTTTAAYLINGFEKRGLNAAYIKLTGTAYPKDKNLAYDLGAISAMDFSSYGYPSTYLCSEQELLSLYESLLSDTLQHKPDYVVVEIADGIFQRETKMLLHNASFMKGIHQVLFSAGDSLSAVHGINTLIEWGTVPAALAGLFTTSPLLIEEVHAFLFEKESLSSLPILTLEDLQMGKFLDSTPLTQLMIA